MWQKVNSKQKTGCVVEARFFSLAQNPKLDREKVVFSQVAEKFCFF
jgi:hypothetical protein